MQADRPSRLVHIWNFISENIPSQIIKLAFEDTKMTHRILAVRLTDNEHDEAIKSLSSSGNINVDWGDKTRSRPMMGTA